MASNTPNLSNPSHEFDKSKQYSKVVFQQGKPILDVDLNDLSEAVLAQTQSALTEKMGYGAPQLDFKEWAVIPVAPILPTSPRNNDNFSFTLGKLDTLKGVIDTSHLKSGNTLDSSIIFDYAKLVTDITVSASSDRPFENYLFKGSVTSTTANTNFSDANKSFSNSHLLEAYSKDLEITPDYPTTASQVNTAISVTRGRFKAVLSESACRVFFLTGANANQERIISNVSGSSIDVSVAFGSPMAAGDEYVIIPPNTLTEYRAEYDAAGTQAKSKSEGLGFLSKLVTYVQVFEEDISSDEDTDIQSSALGFETTHRTQLRWCVRVANYRGSIDGEGDGSGALTTLRPQHIMKLLSLSRNVQHQTLIDSVDATAGNEDGGLLTQYWKIKNSAGADVLGAMFRQVSPLHSHGITPMHFFSAQEAHMDNLFWSFLKCLFLYAFDNNVGGVDVQILNIHNSESKSTAAGVHLETLSPIFYPGQQTDTTGSPMVHARLSFGQGYAGTGDEAYYQAPPRTLHTQAQLSIDNAQSRSLYGLKDGVIVGVTAPLVFPSVSKHMSFLDQTLLGFTGLGSGQGTTVAGKIPSSTDFTLDGTTTSLAQSGYGEGAIKPLNPLVSAAEYTGFVSGTSSYKLREKGTRASHTVYSDDEDLGWNFYKRDANGLAGAGGETDLSIRGWEEGKAQAVAFQQGLNFRKLAIKTSAHACMDLFTISERPPRISRDLVSLDTTADHFNSSAGTAFQIPKSQNSQSSNTFLDSYSSCASDIINNGAGQFIPALVSKFDPKPLLKQYQNTGGISDFRHSDTGANRDLSYKYGPWNRFNNTAISAHSGAVETDPVLVPMDLWSNRCTSMRLRYHVGDFYPGDNDSNGIPRNLLVDSLNLFIKAEPLPLTHWMTMPKHQHSILENSIVFAEGIEALLKVAHGIGDVQKLINGTGQPLAQTNSPVMIEGTPSNGVFDTPVSVGEVDPLDLPFGHEHHPFVHWYHPAQHRITGPHPSGSRTTEGERYIVYPKWGRRSIIVPALIPFDGAIGDSGLPNTAETSSLANLYTHSTDFHDPTNAGLTITVGGKTTGGIAGNAGQPNYDGFERIDRSVFPYQPHATRDEDNSGNEFQGVTDDLGTSYTINEASFFFPHIPSITKDTAPGPVFIPAGRQYAKQDYSNAAGGEQQAVGFYRPYLEENPHEKWGDDVTSGANVLSPGVSEADGASFPFDDKSNYYLQAEDNNANQAHNFSDFNAWSVPALRSAIRTTTVAAIVTLCRTSFETGLDTVSLNPDYTFTMPARTIDVSSNTGEQTPGIGPDVPTDTLFVGDMGTALGGMSHRVGFMSALHLGIGSVHEHGELMPNSSLGLRDSFESGKKMMLVDDQTQPILSTFIALNKMGLQQKLLFNSSLRVLHVRPSGGDHTMTNRGPTAPKSLTEAFLVHDRQDNMAQKPFTSAPTDKDKKAFIHFASTHPASSGLGTVVEHPNYSKMKHLYPMISDSIGGAHGTGAVGGDGVLHYDFQQNEVATSSMGDTYAADPFDYALSEAYLGANNVVRNVEGNALNSGIELDLVRELNLVHTNKAALGLDTVASINGTDIKYIDMMPTANELTLPGDHEIVFVLYTGHYGAKLHDANDTVDTTHVPPVAGCRLTATIEINRPSERQGSTATDEHHYGVTIGGAPLNTYSITSTK